MTRGPVHVVGMLDHSDHRAASSCPCGPEPVRDLNEPSVPVYLHRRPIPEPAAARDLEGRPFSARQSVRRRASLTTTP